MSKTGYNIKGIHELEKAVKEAYSGAKVKNIIREAVNTGAEAVVDTLKTNYENVKDKGYSQGYTAKEIVKSGARSNRGIIEAKVGWNGPNERWRLVHLEEFGYNRHGKQYRPPQFGTIDKSLKEGQEKYFTAVAGRLRKSL